ncbi:hypothetical protein [Campylobacter sp. FU_497]|uniref:hypothetical protein n=1 Tax=Campylobacter sp. FU_497 TaxID=2911610 RepID=UPI00399464FE
MLILWDKILSSNCIQLQHPLNNNIITRAVFNLTLGSVNTIFMIDSENKYPWVFTQASDFMNHIIVNDIIFTVHGKWPVINLFRWKQVPCEFLKYSEKKIGLTMSMELPQHFVFHMGQFFYLMDQNNIIKNTQINPEKCFFLFQKYVKNTLNLDKDNVYLYPMGISNYATREFEKAVYREAVETIEVEEEKNQYDLVVWVGFSSGNYRKWIEVEKGIANFILELNKYFKNIKLYYNGLTDYDSIVNVAQPQSYGSYYDRNNAIFKQICLEIQRVGANCTSVSLDNMDYRHKIAICETVDICISEANTTALVPFSFCNKLGVNLIPPQIPLSRKVGTIVASDDKYILASSDNKDYHVSWQYLFNLSAELLEKLKAVKIHRLDVPSVTLLKQQYEIYKKYQLNVSLENVALLEEIKSYSNNSNENAIYNLEEQNKTLQCNIKKQEEILKKQADLLYFYSKYGTAKTRIQNQLSYKLGQAMIANSKSILGYIRMPFVLSYIKDKHKQEQKIYQEKIKKDLSLKLPPLENYPDYQEALKLKNHLSYKLGQALIQANKTWYKGGYVKLWFEIRNIKCKSEKK